MSLDKSIKCAASIDDSGEVSKDTLIRRIKDGLKNANRDTLNKMLALVEAEDNGTLLVFWPKARDFARPA